MRVEVGQVWGWGDQEIRILREQHCPVDNVVDQYLIDWRGTDPEWSKNWGPTTTWVEYAFLHRFLKHNGWKIVGAMVPERPKSSWQRFKSYFQGAQ